MADDDISWDETEKRLKNIGGAAASGAMAGGVPGALVGAGMSVAMPALSKIFGSAFGGSEAQDARDRAIGDLNRVATGGTTQGQAGAAYQRGTTLQGLEAMAAKGTATQRAGLQRQAMLQAPEIQARQGAQLADLRAKEQEHARATAAYLGQQAAQQDLVSARKSAAGAIGGLAQAGTQLFMGAQGGSPSAATDDAFKETLNLGELGTSNGSTGDKSAEYAKALGFTPGAAAPAAGPNLAGTGSSVPAAVKTGTTGYEDVEQADPNTPNTYVGGAFGGPQRPTDARGRVGVTPSEERMQQENFDTLAAQRNGGIPVAAPSNFKPSTSSALSRNLAEDRLDPSVAASMKTAAEPSPTLAPFGATDLARSSYAGAGYEPARDEMNNSSMANSDRLRKSMRNQIGPIGGRLRTPPTGSR